MSTYVLSDVHGHLAPLDRALSRVSPSDDDRVFVLGDMVDRGPDPVGVMRLVRDLPGSTVLMGNHERLMLDALARPDDTLALYNWVSNGGDATHRAFASLGVQARVDLFEWVDALPLRAHAFVGDSPYLFAHAGIRPGVTGAPDVWDDASCEAFLAAQDDNDLLWIREDFWGRPTGLLDGRGEGPIVVSGHTPTPLAAPLCDRPDREPLDAGGMARMLRVGACEGTAGVPDRMNIDCACASGAPHGRVLVLRLDDGDETYEAVLDGE